jgi:stage III sporulation protein SpoIIIAA
VGELSEPSTASALSATAKGNKIENLFKNKTLSNQVGGIPSVTLENLARKRLLIQQVPSLRK